MVTHVLVYLATKEIIVTQVSLYVTCANKSYEYLLAMTIISFDVLENLLLRRSEIHMRYEHTHDKTVKLYEIKYGPA